MKTNVNYLFLETEPIATAIGLEAEKIEVNNGFDFEKKQNFIKKEVDDYLATTNSRIVINATKKYGGWLRRKMIACAMTGKKMEYC